VPKTINWDEQSLGERLEFKLTDFLFESQAKNKLKELKKDEKFKAFLKSQNLTDKNLTTKREQSTQYYLEKTFEIPNLDQQFLESSLLNDIETKIKKSFESLFEDSDVALSKMMSFKLSIISVPILNLESVTRKNDSVLYAKRLHVHLLLSVPLELENYLLTEKQINLSESKQEAVEFTFIKTFLKKCKTFHESIQDIGGNQITGLYAQQIHVYRYLSDWSLKTNNQPVEIGRIIQRLDKSFYNFKYTLIENEKKNTLDFKNYISELRNFYFNKLKPELLKIEESFGRSFTGLKPSIEKYLINEIKNSNSEEEKPSSNANKDGQFLLSIWEILENDDYESKGCENVPQSQEALIIHLIEFEKCLLDYFSTFSSIFIYQKPSQFLHFENRGQMLEFKLVNFNLNKRAFGSFYGLPYLHYMDVNDTINEAPILYDFLKKSKTGTFEIHGKIDIQEANDRKEQNRKSKVNIERYFQNHLHVQLLKTNERKLKSKLFTESMHIYFEQFVDAADEKTSLDLGLIYFEKVSEDEMKYKNKKTWRKMEYSGLESKNKHFAAVRLLNDQEYLFLTLQGGSLLETFPLYVNTQHRGRIEDLSRLGFLTTKNTIDFYSETGTYFGVNYHAQEKLPVFVNLSEYKNLISTPQVTNGHMTVIGRSGSGKTYFVNSLLYQKQKNHRVFIFDIEDEYKKICEVIDVNLQDEKVNEFFSLKTIGDSKISVEETIKASLKISFEKVNKIEEKDQKKILNTQGALILFLKKLLEMNEDGIKSILGLQKENIEGLHHHLSKFLSDLTQQNLTYKTFDISDPGLSLNPWFVIQSDDERKAIDRNDSTVMRKVFDRHVSFLARFLMTMFHVKDARFLIEMQDLIMATYFQTSDQTKSIKDISELFRGKRKRIENISFNQFGKLLNGIDGHYLQQFKSKISFEETSYFYEDIKYKYSLLEKNPIFASQYLNQQNNGTEISNGLIDQLNHTKIIRFQVNAVLNLGGASGFPLLSFMTLLNYLNIQIFNRDIGYDREGIFVVVDEAHRYLNQSLIDMVELLVAISKQGRKRSTELCLASQNLSDFYRSSDSKDIEQKARDVLKNTGYKFIMQSSQELNTIYEFIESAYPMTDLEKSLIKKLSRGQGFLINGSTDKTPVFVKIHPDLETSIKHFDTFTQGLDNI
jgi:hypothetical protein